MSGLVLRVLLLVVFALFVGDATGLLAEVDQVACTDEPDGKQCPPTCPSCSCDWHAPRLAAPAPTALARAAIATTIMVLPPIHDSHGRLAPPPVHRPPIA